MTDFPTGRFCWYECYSADPKASERFYTDLLGWGSMPWGPGGPDGAYTVIANGGVDLGGYMQLTDEMKGMKVPPHWLVYVATPDADATARQAAELGGRVVREPFDVPEVGRIVVISDPQGAVLCGFQPAGDPPGYDDTAPIGGFSWHELLTSDWSSAWDFYSQLFGWEKTGDFDMGEAGTYQMYGNGAHTLGGMYNKGPDVPGPAWLFYVRVEGVDDMVEKVKAAGGQVTMGPMEVPGGDKVAQCIDPQGVAFAIHSKAVS